MAIKETVHKKKIRDLLLIIIGTFFLCVSVQMFILPYNILSGGVAGIAVAAQPFLHIDKTLAANTLTLCLLGIGSVILGREFFVTTVFSSVLYPIFNSILLRTLVIPNIEPVLASFYGGLLGGIGVGMVMRAGASTGGMDVPPLVINKLTGFKISTLVLLTDGLTVLLGYFAYGIEAVLVGLISVFATSYAINRVLSIGDGQVAKSVQIISDHWEAIVADIQRDLNRGVTLMDGEGGWSRARRKVVLCVVDQKQYPNLIEIVEQNDPSAFVITTDATDMHGEGFTYGFRI
ncbi:MAG: YitT family protein [Solobacterium sp.]|nr:YitT family protein [Solobacterium sp.]MBR3346345.1 YitT family protein [Solobacterium sp.]